MRGTSVGRRPRSLSLAVAAALGALGAAAMMLVVLRSAGIDTYHYWAGSRLAFDAGVGFYSSSGADLLRREPLPASPVEALAHGYWQQRPGTESAADGPFISTPFYWATMRLLLAGDFASALRRFQLLSVASLVVALAMLARAAGATALAAGALVAFAGIGFLPTIYDLATGNVNGLLLLAGALWLVLAAARHESLVLVGDFLLGLSITFKPVWIMVPPLVICDVWRAGERWRAVRRAAAVGLGAGTGLATGALFMGSLRVWPEWAARVAAARYVRGNVSPLRLLGALELGPWAALAALTVGVALTCASASRARPVAPLERGFQLLALGGLLFLLSSTLLRIHYLVAALPALALALGGWRRRSWLETALAGAAAVAVGYVPRHLGLLGGAASAALAAVGVGVLTVGVGARIWRRNRDAPTPTDPAVAEA